MTLRRDRDRRRSADELAPVGVKRMISKEKLHVALDAEPLQQAAVKDKSKPREA